MAIDSLWETVVEGIEEGAHVGSGFCDHSKTSDYVSHIILVENFNIIVSQNYYNLIDNYLSDRLLSM